MGMFAAVFAAFITRLTGCNIFRDPKEVGSGPLVSCYLFLLALFLLFYDLRLYPRSLRSLGRNQVVIEYLIANFLMESLVLDFWFPLETAVMSGLGYLSDQIDEMLQTTNWNCESLCDFLKDDSTKLVASYILSTFFLMAVLHAVRAIDLRTLRDGPTAFFQEILFRLKKALKRKLKVFKFGGKRRVKIKEPKPLTPCGSSGCRAGSGSNYDFDMRFSNDCLYQD